MSDTERDFRIPDPAEGTRTNDFPAREDIGERGAEVDGLFNTGISTTELIIAGVVLLFWLGLMLLPRKTMISSLNSQFADYSKAKAAGNALYALLVVTGIIVALGLLVDDWTSMHFILPSSIILLILLVVFLISFGSARASRVRSKRN
jgi:hypothetical protein